MELLLALSRVESAVKPLLNNPHAAWAFDLADDELTRTSAAVTAFGSASVLATFTAGAETSSPGIGQARDAWEEATRACGDDAAETRAALETYMNSVKAVLATVDAMETAINTELGGAYMKENPAAR